MDNDPIPTGANPMADPIARPTTVPRVVAEKESQQRTTPRRRKGEPTAYHAEANQECPLKKTVIHPNSMEHTVTNVSIPSMIKSQCRTHTFQRLNPTKKRSFDIEIIKFFTYMCR